MIRNLRISDIDAVLPLCREHFAAVNMTERFYTFDEATSRATLVKLINSESSRCLVSENKGIDGICVFIIAPSLFDEKDIKAVEFLWYSRSPKIFIKLFEEMEVLLKDIPTLGIGMPSNYSTTLQKYLKKKGFINTEISYSRRNVNV